MRLWGVSCPWLMMRICELTVLVLVLCAGPCCGGGRAELAKNSAGKMIFSETSRSFISLHHLHHEHKIPSNEIHFQMNESILNANAK